jgi:hypothetical protein
MSKVDSLKQQYPELNISLIDILVRMDKSKTNKYLPLLCKIFSSKYRNEEKNHIITDNDKNFIKGQLETRGIKISDLSLSEMYLMYNLLDIIPGDRFSIFQEFQEYMERGLINNKDVLTYNTLDDVRRAISVASLKAQSKEMEKQAIKIYEDEEWVVVRPLTFEASAAYGSGTKWCTTQRTEKQYFARYWKRGILAYFINKINGVKYGLFKTLEEGDREVSWWNTADDRVDFLEIDFGPEMYGVAKEILKSTQSNKDLCDIDLQLKVLVECGQEHKEELGVRREPVAIPEQEPQFNVIHTPVGNATINRLTEEFHQMIDQHIEGINNIRNERGILPVPTPPPSQAG